MEPDTLLDGRYRLRERIGAGGMGVVWRAWDQRLNRDVAVKVLSGSSDDNAQVRQLTARFEREAQVAAGLSNPHIVTVHDYGRTEVDDRQVLYLVMELLAGRPLNTRLADGQLRLTDVLDWGRQICDGLALAHARGVIHRDIKPANIMVGENGHVTLLDFGIARILERAADDSEITGTGVAIGTAGYMSPEQADGARHVDERSDVYSLGCVFYAMVTGRPPFPSGPWYVVMEKHRSERPEPPSHRRKDLPKGWDDVILSMLAKDPRERPQSAPEVRERLDRFTAGTVSPPPTTVDPPTQQNDEADRLTASDAAPSPRAPAGEETVVYLPRVRSRRRGVLIGEWFKSEGDHVTVGEPLVEAATDKAKFEILAPSGGVLRKIFVHSGESSDDDRRLAMINADEPVGDLLRDIPTRPGRVTRLFEQWTTQVTGSLALALGSALIVDWRWLGGERGVSTLSAGFAAFIMGLIVFWPFARYAPEVIQRSALHSEIRGRNFAGEALGLAPVILLGAAAAALNLATAIAREGMPRGVGDWAGALLFLLVVTGGTAAICWGVAAISNETAADALEFWYGNGDRDEVAQVMVLGGWVLAIISGEQLLEYENNPTPILFKTHLIWLLGTAWMALSMVAGLHFSRLFRPLLNRR